MPLDSEENSAPSPAYTAAHKPTTNSDISAVR